jgi:hypothetical protein
LLTCDKRFIKSIMVSAGSSRAINLSRVDPALLTINPPRRADCDKYTLTTLRYPILPALCYSVITVGESFLYSPRSAQAPYIKYLTGKLFTGEMERLVGTVLMALNMQDANAPLYKDWLSFTCRPLSGGEHFI